MKLSGKIWVLLFCLFCIPVITKAQVSAPGSAPVERINSFKADISIQSNGSAKVSETFVYNFGNQQKHGIYRNIPVVLNNSYGKLSTKVYQVSVVDDIGQAYQFTDYYSGNDFVIKIGDPNATISGVKTFVIYYSIRRVVNFFSDHDEFYWNVTGNEWSVPIASAQATVSLPGQTEKNSLQVQCFAGPLGGTSPCQTANVLVNGGSFAQNGLNNNEGLTIVFGFPKGMVGRPTIWQNFLQIAQDNWIVVVPIFVFFGMFLLWWFKGRDPKVSDIIVAQYEAPAGLSPAQALELLKFSEPPRGITAEIIQLAVKGYIKINRLENKDYQFQKLKTPDIGLMDFQQTLMAGLFTSSSLEQVFGSAGAVTELVGKLSDKPLLAGFLKNLAGQQSDPAKDKDAVLLSDLKDLFYSSLNTAKGQITKSLISQKYFTAGPQVTKLIYSIIAVFVGFAGFFAATIFGVVGLVSLILSALVVLFFGLAMPRRSLAGALLAKQILGLKLYLNVAEKDRLEFHNAPEKTPQRFEKLLPYAIALGVEKQWAKQFEGIYTSPPSWYNDRYGTFTSLALVNSLNNFHSVSSSSLASSPHSSASGGGSGFSGGFSGGGFGGGGGGSW
jgi:uncharacterized membrane protein